MKPAAMLDESPRVVRRRCECCGATVVHVWKLIAPARFKNPRDCDYPVDLAAGALACRKCIEHNEHERLANPLKPARTRKRCHRCGGAGRVRNPLLEHIEHGRGLHQVSLRRRALWWRCSVCNGAGKVAAS